LENSNFSHWRKRNWLHSSQDCTRPALSIGLDLKNVKKC
jgi:hypothetical protein